MKSQPNEDSLINEILAVKLRLDALIALQVLAIFKNEKGKVNSAEACPLLYSVGLTPSEVAALVGKKKSTDITQYLFKKK